ISGCNIPGAAEFAARNLRANRLANNDVGSIGPRLDERPERERRLPFISIHGEVTWQSTNLPPARAWYQAELRERKSFGRERVWVPGRPLHVDGGRRAKTSERRNEQGEYGPEVRVTPDGRLYFNKHKAPVINGVPIKVRGISSYTVERAVRLKNGRTRK